jgi:hypothetical protein
LLGGVGEEYEIIERNHKKGLAIKNGRVVIPPEYEDLGWTNGSTKLLENVIGFRKGSLCGILNTKNEKVTEPIYTSLTRFNDEWIIASKKLPYNASIVYGVINAKGNAEVAFQYHMLSVQNEHMIASEYREDGYHYGVLDDRAREVIPVTYDRIRAVSDDFYEVSEGDHIAIFNEDGDNLTGFELDSIKAIEQDYFLTYQNGKTGLLGKQGELIIPPSYKNIVVDEEGIRAQQFREWIIFSDSNEKLKSLYYDEIIPSGRELYKVSIGAAEALISASDSLLTPFSNVEILEQYGEWLSIRKSDKYGVLHLDVKVFLDPVYDSIRYVNGQFIVKHKLDGKRGWSLINNLGQVVTDQIYDEIEWLGDAYYQVKRDNYWGIANDQGDEIIYCKYDSIIQYTEGKLLVEFLGEDGILNLNGVWEILPQKREVEIVDPLRYLIRSPYGSFVAYYPETIDFRAEFFLYKHGDRYLEKTLDQQLGLRNEDGVRIIKPEFVEISDLQEDSIYFARSHSGYSFITKSGEVMVSNDPRFEEINDMSEEFIGVKIDGRWGFVDINGKLRVANQYENIGPYNEGLAPIKILGRWGYIDKREDIMVQPAYDTVYSFKNGLCEVVKKGKFGLINASGQITLECEYDYMKRLKTGGFLTRKNNKYGLASDRGRLLILPRFDEVKDLDNGFVIASRKGRYGLMSNGGVNIIPMIYEEMKYDPYNDVYLAAKSPEWIQLDLQ